MKKVVLEKWRDVNSPVPRGCQRFGNDEGREFLRLLRHLPERERRAALKRLKELARGCEPSAPTDANGSSTIAGFPDPAP